jgi:hypothetical protein
MARDACYAPVSRLLLLLDVVDRGICSNREREGRGLFVVLPVGTTTSGGMLRLAL